MNIQERPWSRVLVLTTCLIAGCAGSLAQEPPPTNAFGLRADRAFFWEGTAPGEEKPRLYLLGSMHMLDQPIVLGPEIERAFANSELLVLEADLQSLDLEARGELMIRYGMLTWGEKLEDFVSSETIAALERWLDQRSLQPEERDVFLRLRPWASAMSIVQASYQEHGALAVFGIEQYFLARAGAQRRVVGLETADEQFFALSSHSAAVQEQFLVEALAMGAGDSAVNQLLDVWKSGDGEALAALVYSASEANAEFYETIYYARNERMSDRLIELLQEEPDSTCFAIVGAGHLIGDFSVVDRLEGGGYRMRRGGRD